MHPVNAQQVKRDWLGEVYPIEQARVRTILGIYKTFGVVGSTGARLIEGVLIRADRAAINGDVIAMLGCYEEMRAVKE